MNTRHILPIVCLMLISFISSTAQSTYPSAILKNSELEMKVYLPDAQTGYYRGTRFDWSGVIGSLLYKDHQYFDPWLEKHDPYLHEAITGPVEAFAPIGYDSAKPGQHFLIIGVGVLEKPDDKPYHFATPFKIADTGKWKVKKKKDKLVFSQKLTMNNGLAFQYIKTVQLLKDRPNVILEHQLKNIGSQDIETTVYNHNFFVIDQEPTGPNILTRFPYSIQAEGRGFGEMIMVNDTELIFQQELKKGQHVYTAGITGFRPVAQDYHFNIENKKSGAGVKITADQPLLKLAYWACHSTACPEPFIDIKVAPSQTYRWAIEYEFYEF